MTKQFRASYLYNGRVEDIPPVSQEEVNQFYSIIGYIITHWAHIDRAMFDCFFQVLGSSEKTAAQIWYQFQIISKRIELLDATLRNAVHGEFLNEWKAIKAELDPKLRNYLAHHPIQVTTTIKNVSHLTPDTPMEVHHVIYCKFQEKELLAGKRKDRTIYLPELKAEFEKVGRLHEAITAYSSRLRQQSS